jgi:hypothetical protein
MPQKGDNHNHKKTLTAVSIVEIRERALVIHLAQRRKR